MQNIGKSTSFSWSVTYNQCVSNRFWKYRILNDLPVCTYCTLSNLFGFLGKLPTISFKSPKFPFFRNVNLSFSLGLKKNINKFSLAADHVADICWGVLATSFACNVKQLPARLIKMLCFAKNIFEKIHYRKEGSEFREFSWNCDSFYFCEWFVYFNTNFESLARGQPHSPTATV